MDAKTEPTSTLHLQLIKEMRSGRFAKSKRLPRETVLSEQYGISRTHLRDILAQLEREGFITRRHGVGTVINRHVLQVRNRMDIEAEFLEIIRNNGYDPAVAQVTIHEECADDTVAGKLLHPSARTHELNGDCMQTRKERICPDHKSVAVEEVKLI